MIKASSGLDDAEIEKMIKDAEANAEADRKFEELVSARNTLEGLTHATKKTLEEAGDKATADEKSSIEAAIAQAETALKGDDKEAIEAATKALTDASGTLAQKLYAEKGDKGQGDAESTKADDATNAAEDGAVDAEFEEVKEDR